MSVILLLFFAIGRPSPDPASDSAQRSRVTYLEAFFCRYGYEYDPERIEYALREFSQHWYLGDAIFSDDSSYPVTGHRASHPPTRSGPLLPCPGPPSKPGAATTAPTPITPCQ